jgi:hypothetical protein
VNEKLSVDATRLSQALKYQIHVAIDYCHTLDPEDVLWIEVYGDVTVEGRDQVEVKDYNSDLTDGHENFWKTLNNWLDAGFEHQKYVSLVLLTTQQFGVRASLRNWSDLDAAQRLDALEEIHQAAENRYAERSGSQDADDADVPQSCAGSGRRERIPDSLKLQRLVMAAEVRAELLQVLPKVKIITGQPDLRGLIDAYKKKYLRGVLPNRKDDFLDDLFGFMTNAMKMSTKWRFTCAEFDAKIAELTARYVVGTVKFPRLDARQVGLEAQAINVRDRLYARKLEEIGGDEVLIRQATVERLSAQKYISELYSDAATSPEDVEDYCTDHLRLHCSSRLAQIGRSNSTLSHPERQSASRTFYHETCAQPVVRFGGFDSTPVAFRNGVYHLLADQDSVNPIGDLQWRLWE